MSIWVGVAIGVSVLFLAYVYTGRVKEDKEQLETALSVAQIDKEIAALKERALRSDKDYEEAEARFEELKRRYADVIKQHDLFGPPKPRRRPS